MINEELDTNMNKGSLTDSFKALFTVSDKDIFMSFDKEAKKNAAKKISQYLLKDDDAISNSFFDDKNDKIGNYTVTIKLGVDKILTMTDKDLYNYFRKKVVDKEYDGDDPDSISNNLKTTTTSSSGSVSMTLKSELKRELDKKSKDVDDKTNKKIEKLALKYTKLFATERNKINKLIVEAFKEYFNTFSVGSGDKIHIENIVTSVSREADVQDVLMPDGEDKKLDNPDTENGKDGDEDLDIPKDKVVVSNICTYRLVYKEIK